MSSEAPGCCRWCTGFIFSSGLTALFMWLSLRPSKPNFSIEKFEVPALNISANSTGNTAIYFDLRFSNTNKDKRVYYDAVNVTLFYGQNLSYPIGNVTIPSFRQGHKKKATKSGSFQPVGLPWVEVRREVNETKMTVFRVHVATKVRYKIIFWTTKRHTIKVGGTVTVDDQGVKPKKKKAKLSSAASQDCYAERTGMLVSFVLILFWL